MHPADVAWEVTRAPHRAHTIANCSRVSVTWSKLLTVQSLSNKMDVVSAALPLTSFSLACFQVLHTYTILIIMAMKVLRPLGQTCETYQKKLDVQIAQLMLAGRDVCK